MRKIAIVLLTLFAFTFLNPAEAHAVYRPENKISINEFEVDSCGTQEVTISGNAEFKIDLYGRKIKVFDGSDKLFEKNVDWYTTSTSYSFTEEFEPGTYTINAGTYMGKYLERRAKATRVLEIPECPDVCSNIEGNQTEVPEGMYETEGACYDRTPVCTDEVANNTEEVDETTYSDNDVCTYDDAPYCYEGETILVPDNEEAPEGAEEGACIIDEIDDEETPESTSSYKAPENTFHPDTRCHGETPPAPTWSIHEDGILTWSAEGGQQVELQFGFLPNVMPFNILLTNDGHQETGIGTDIGWWGGYWKLRTINNGCKEGPWTPVLSGHGTW